MPSDREWMEKAIAQARKSKAEAGHISPMVGAVVIDRKGEFLTRLTEVKMKKGKSMPSSAP